MPPAPAGSDVRADFGYIDVNTEIGPLHDVHAHTGPMFRRRNDGRIVLTSGTGDPWSPPRDSLVAGGDGARGRRPPGPRRATGAPDSLNQEAWA